MQLKSIFFTGIALLVLFEIANVYFIMPMPGSQEMNSLPIAYFLYKWRWVFRTIATVLMVVGAWSAWRNSRWVTTGALVLAAATVWMFNFNMNADHMFFQPGRLEMADSSSNKISLEKLVIGVNLNGIAKAYPIQLIGYHHQVRDTFGREPVMITYCTVCRTGRVFRPEVHGKPENFRLVGMDHFNAMFEDETTGSWWRQATGEAVAGKLAGEQLPEIFCTQTSLSQWLQMYPVSLIMQPDSTFSEEYAHMDSYDFGIDRGELTRTDTLSWKEKSWVAAVDINGASAAFDWNQLKQEKIINDSVGPLPIVLALANDDKSFFAFERPDGHAIFEIRNDTLCSGGSKWNLKGEPYASSATPLKKIIAYQEFWHSWRTFHGHTRFASDSGQIGH